MNLVDKSFNVRRGFADVEIQSEQLLFTCKERRDDLKQQIADINSAMSSKIKKDVRRRLAGQRRQLQGELNDVVLKINAKINLPELQRERYRSALTKEVQVECDKLALSDYERLANQIHIEAD